MIIDGQLHDMTGEQLARRIEALGQDGLIRTVALHMLSEADGVTETWGRVAVCANLTKPVRQSALHDCLVGLASQAFCEMRNIAIIMGWIYYGK